MYLCNSICLECKDDWIMFRESCYKLFQRPEYYDTAQSLCKVSTASLMTINDEFENKFAHQVIANNTLNEAWLGYKRSSFQTWEDLTENYYTNWAFTSPSGIGRCIQIIKGGKWNNVGCLSQLPFICEKCKILKSVSVRTSACFVL